MELVAGAADGALGNEFRLEASRGRIERRVIEIDHAVERARGADELVESLPFGVLLGETMRRAGAAQCRDDGGADDARLRPFRAQPRYAILHRGDDLVGRGVAVLGEIVDAFQPDQARYAGKRQHIAIEPLA